MDTETFNPGPLMAAGADRRPAIAAAIGHLMTADHDQVLADFSHTHLSDRYRDAPELLLALLLTAEPTMDRETLANFYGGAVTVLRCTGVAEPDHAGLDPDATPYERFQAGQLDAARARCTGIRCTHCHHSYEAIWTDGGSGPRFLCEPCLPLTAEKYAARSFRVTYTPVPGGVPDGARYMVRLYNGTGRGGKRIVCRRPEDAQIVAETVRPYNNTGAEIWVKTD